MGNVSIYVLYIITHSPLFRVGVDYVYESPLAIQVW